MPKRRNPFVDYLVFVAVRLMVAVIQALPMEWGYGIARWIAWLGYTVDRRHRKVANENLRKAFGDSLGDQARAKMVRGVYDHFAKVIIEIAHIPRKLRFSNWKRYVRLNNVEGAVKCILSDRPTLIVTGHFGNWEMAGYLVAALGIKSFAIARELDNPYLDRYLKKFRQYTGQTILSKNGDFDRIQQVLIDRGVLISVGDQSAGPRGYFVDFFGHPASTHKAIALLAMRHQANVFVGYAYRDREGFHYTVECGDPLFPSDYGEERNAALNLTRDVIADLERAVRKAPEQYLWLHNRWKHTPQEKPVRQAA